MLPRPLPCMPCLGRFERPVRTTGSSRSVLPGAFGVELRDVIPAKPGLEQYLFGVLAKFRRDNARDGGRFNEPDGVADHLDVAAHQRMAPIGTARLRAGGEAGAVLRCLSHEIGAFTACVRPDRDADG